MPLELSVQFEIVIYSIIAGFVTGLLFDLYRIIRGGKLPRIIVLIQDVLFWILSAMTIFTFLLYTNYAFLTAYVYMFIGTSLLLYFRFISNKIFKVEMIIYNGTKKTIRVTVKTTRYPFKILWSKLGNKSK